MVPNEYKDTLSRIRIPGQARQVLDVIERLTMGWNRREAKISLKTFRKMTGLKDKHILKGRSLLLKMRIISTPQKGSRREVYYRILKDYSNWQPLPKREVKTTPQLGYKSLPKKGTTTPVPKDINVKDIIYKDSEINMPTKELKKRLEELKEDLKEERYEGEKNYVREGIKEIEGLLKEAKNGQESERESLSQ